MEEFPGALGTSASLILRLGQAFFSSASLLFMCWNNKFFRYSAFCFLKAVMSIVIPWSLCLALVDACSILLKRPIRRRGVVSFIVTGDWIFVASRARAVRVENISRLLDISNIHQFKVNDKSILYLNSRSKQEPREIRDNTFKKCKMCQWPIDTQLFCSIGCKVKSNMPFVTDNYEHTHLFKKSNKKDNTPNSSKKETVKNSRKGIPKRSPFF
ncbi:uncharacterized protein At3g50808-like isoform X1 [Actinidia eriantha]|uniref:uncharacterized protein At3g50808-like isoform X1 n=1 Tax=Actinidia eriantha TaxID=165200 RepID=UPI0025865AD4|nr:uncharacterized protein At3g50808-like isoform X1 [Actinidia eriantha]